MQSSGGLCDVANRARAVHPDAGVGSGRRASLRRKTVGDVARARQPDLLRHGRHDGQSVRAARRQRATFARLFRRRLQRRSGHPHSGHRHQGSRHRRRQHRLDRRSRRSARRSGERRREPGPACLRHAAATLPTVTDAHLVLGRLVGGPFPRRAHAARPSTPRRERSKRTSRDRWASTSPSAASGILAIANATMANAVRAVTTERGLDPRDFALVAYGGAGPLHAVDIARELAIRTVIVPRRARTLLGLRHAGGRLAARVRAHASRTAATDDSSRGIARSSRSNSKPKRAAWLAASRRSERRRRCSNGRPTCATSDRIMP